MKLLSETSFRLRGDGAAVRFVVVAAAADVAMVTSCRRGRGAG